MQGSRSIPSLLLALGMASWTPVLSAQALGSVVGAVIDEATQTPLPAATVSLVDAQLSAVTDQNGQFVLEGLPAGEWSVKVAHLSHVSIVEPVVVSSGEVTVIQFALSPVAFVLDQLKVVAERGTPPPEGTAFSEMEPRATDFNSTAMDLLVARFPSLSVTGGDRDGGMNKRVQLRGVRSVMIDNAPFLYVDGVRAEISLLATISAWDVKSIRVLRGPSASSLYPNASNGVIVVETRRGRIGGGP